MKRADFEKKLHIEDPMFEQLRLEINNSIQETIYNMVSHEAETGTVSIKLTLVKEKLDAPNRDTINKLHFAHKVSNSVTLKSDTKKGERMNCDDELVFVDDEWVMMPIVGVGQRSLLDEEDA